MSCMDALGVDVVVQAEANPGRWAANVANRWPPLHWIGSTWRTVSAPRLRFPPNPPPPPGRPPPAPPPPRPNPPPAPHAPPTPTPYPPTPPPPPPHHTPP